MRDHVRCQAAEMSVNSSIPPPALSLELQTSNMGQKIRGPKKYSQEFQSYGKWGFRNLALKTTLPIFTVGH